MGWLPIIVASEKGDLDVLKMLVDHGANINAQDADDRTALMIAVKHRQPAMIRFLLAHGADQNIKDKYKETVLEIAQSENYTEAVEILKGNK